MFPRAWLLTLAGWTVPAVLSTSLIVVRAGSTENAASWGETFIQQLPSWWIWALLTPGVFALSRQWPIQGRPWWKSLLVHSMLGVGTVILYMALEAPFAILREGRAVDVGSWAGAVVGGLSFQFVTHYLIYFALVGLSHAFDGARRIREGELEAARLERELGESRLLALRTQLQPHFLFNTLHAIGGMIREGHGEKAIRMLSGLSGLLRHTLDQVQKPRIPLHEEMEALERYIEIEEARFEDRLQVERVIDAECAQALVPALLLQPLVENAVRHGVEARRGVGKVRIAASRTGDRMKIIVEDDGPGFPPGFQPGLQARIGLGTTTRRLEEGFGDRARIAFTNATTGGARVLVDLPWELEQGNE